MVRVNVRICIGYNASQCVDGSAHSMDLHVCQFCLTTVNHLSSLRGSLPMDGVCKQQGMGGLDPAKLPPAPSYQLLLSTLRLLISTSAYSSFGHMPPAPAAGPRHRQNNHTVGPAMEQPSSSLPTTHFSMPSCELTH